MTNHPRNNSRNTPTARRRAALLAVLCTAACGVALVAFTHHARAQQNPTQPTLRIPAPEGDAGSAPRFVAVEVRIDPAGQPLAAWQFELASDDPRVRIVGLEGSTHSAFNNPPYYDPAAMATNRVVAASFNTGPPASLPTANLRVATVMVMVPPGSTPTFTATLAATADAAGDPIPNAAATITEGTVR